MTESPLTRAGVLVGTPAYMAPEQFLRMALTTRTDQFSFCIALYEALYGARPFDGNTVETIRENVLLGRVREPPRNPVPAWVRRIVARGLQVASDDRFPDMRALLDALGRDPAVQRRRWAIAGGVVLALFGLVGLYTRLLAQQRPAAPAPRPTWRGSGTRRASSRSSRRCWPPRPRSRRPRGPRSSAVSTPTAASGSGAPRPRASPLTCAARPRPSGSTSATPASTAASSSCARCRRCSRARARPPSSRPAPPSTPCRRSPRATTTATSTPASSRRPRPTSR
ncbi:protein kinase [Nannocystis pusilla]|uniref:protein kinase n=1 Tax=Nannocystis pusilla TaxID=889268 RepID=UPI003B7D8F78